MYVCVVICTGVQEPTDFRRGYQIPGAGVTQNELRTKLGSSERVEHTLGD